MHAISTIVGLSAIWAIAGVKIEIVKLRRFYSAVLANLAIMGVPVNKISKITVKIFFCK